MFGGSILFWSIYGIIHKEGILDNPLIHLGVFVLNLMVGILIMVRKPAIISGSAGSILISLPSFIIGPVFFYFSAPLAEWSFISKGLFAVGCLITIMAFLFLGKNFAIFPALRGVTRNGPYALVRHPAYLGELIIVVSCLMTNPTLIPILLFALLVPFLILRILEEERVLIKSIEYQQFQNHTRWRLIPFIW